MLQCLTDSITFPALVFRCDCTACSRTQSWWAHNATNPEQRLSELRDGVKYLVGIMWLPTGWELG